MEDIVEIGHLALIGMPMLLAALYTGELSVGSHRLSSNSHWKRLLTGLLGAALVGADIAFWVAE